MRQIRSLSVNLRSSEIISDIADYSNARENFGMERIIALCSEMAIPQSYAFHQQQALCEIRYEDLGTGLAKNTITRCSCTIWTSMLVRPKNGTMK